MWGAHESGTMLIAQVVFDGFTDIDVFLAWDLLNRVRHPGWQVKLLGTATHHTSRSGLTIPMHGDVSEATAADAVLFGSGPSTRELRLDPSYLARFELDPERQLIGSMCSGALLLHALGLLNGKRATTHPIVRELLRAEGIEVVDEAFVREGNVATAAACLAGVDLAAWVVEYLLGAAARDAMLEEVRPVGRQNAFPSDGSRAAVAVENEPPLRAETSYEGSCLCGAVHYEVAGELGEFGYCHCKSCRKASGTAHAANAPVDRRNFRIVRGAHGVRQFESSPGKFRAFCSRCGSPLYAYLASTPDVLRVRLGTLDTPFTKHARAHTFVADKAPWEEIDGRLPQFPEWAPKSVLHQRGSHQDDTG
jgi:putative intracellular protease/amidase